MNTESRKVFKPTSAQSERYTYSSNTVHGCNKCLKKRQPGEPLLSVCKGCKCTRYCVSPYAIGEPLPRRVLLTFEQSRECQKADWEEHKSFCKKKKQALDTVENMDMTSLPPHIRNFQQHMLTVEDFVRAHTFTFQSALQEIATLAAPFDFRRKYVLVTMKERESGMHDGNPATRYEVLDMELRDNPVRYESGDTIMEEAFVQCVEPSYDDWEKMTTGNPLVWGQLVVMYRVGDNLPFPLPLALSKPYPAPKLFDRDHYMSTVKEFTGKGIVFRLIKNVRKQGVMEKSGENWVFREKTQQELRECSGVDVTGAFIDPLELLSSVVG
ncbi:hypothetical protein BDN70DRAFT_932090 [Pholiota conissans]|uniref:MYND-type domain-containing protein n=1 Tax=Pholiota conissans TaxID=109636 RepID=A0A9P5Z229_9AGAR|nr:hypothetical protein BDN70DRAFT_932090 [Pholiota conissans]